MRRMPLLTLAILLAALTAPFTVSADCEPARITRALAIEEPWLENAVYLMAQGTQALSGAADLAFSRNVGMEIDLPTWNPVSHALSPAIGAGLKIRLDGPCQPRISAAYVTAEVEGQYNAQARSAPPGFGDSVTGQLEWAVTRPYGFWQGEIGHSASLGRGGARGSFVNASLGQTFGPLTLQCEGEIDDMLPPGPYGAIEGSVWPQLALHLGRAWLIALGEERTFTRAPGTPKWSTWLLLEREFD